jgi:hypothetical protein
MLLAILILCDMATRSGAQILAPILFGNRSAPAFTAFGTWSNYGSHANTAARGVWSNYGSHQE